MEESLSKKGEMDGQISTFAINKIKVIKEELDKLMYISIRMMKTLGMEIIDYNL